MKLKDNTQLKASPVVANSAMNRERNLQGTNSYSKDLAFDILAFLKENQPVKWLDLCCGSGKALIEMEEILTEAEIEFSIIGVDLIPIFDELAKRPANSVNFLLQEADLSVWNPEDDKFDLITCVHGLHYIGDKLDLIRRAVSWLKPDGVFLANLDLKSLRRGKERSKKIPTRVLLRRGLEYNNNTHILSCKGYRCIEFPQFTYLGADDQAGPNYTLQPAVNSHYKHINGSRNRSRSKAAKQRRQAKREEKTHGSA